ncbi:uncharacterized protein Dana_GF13091 [Drosophila ananassae]|uniref:Peptidase S1 domain-containing protein n=1 Tax=Drosophila ananassae TaxID=7217 RepID=B3MFL9_DROAN|nr:phenoloxidase-activating factor 2 [Drosophila ananassae]EDV36704.2 uncharacterized protein Dana_GF13091 [Drosophila ananassae]
MTHDNIRIVAGDWNLKSDQESFAPEERRVNLIKKHEKFNHITGANNLAIVILNQPFPLKDHIQTICLPSQQGHYMGNKCKVAGWGVKKFGDESFSDVQKVVELSLVDQDQCEDQLRQTELGPDFQLDPSLICAGGEEDVDSCTGDGGSALFCQLREDRSRYVQVGIVNWGMKCGQKDVPAVYTNVEMFRDWIHQQLKLVPSCTPGQFKSS